MSKVKKVRFFDIDNTIEKIQKALQNSDLIRFTTLVDRMPNKLNLEDVFKIVNVIINTMTEHFDDNLCTQAYKTLYIKYDILVVKSFNIIRRISIENDCNISDEIRLSCVKSVKSRDEELRKQSNQDSNTSDETITQKHAEEKESVEQNTNIAQATNTLSSDITDKTSKISFVPTKSKQNIDTNETYATLENFIIKNFWKWLEYLPVEIKEYFSNSSLVKDFLKYISFLTKSNPNSIFTTLVESAFKAEFEDNYKTEKIETTNELKLENKTDNLLEQETKLDDLALNKIPLAMLFPFSLTLLHHDCLNDGFIGKILSSE